MIFHEIYGSYYLAAAAVLKEAVRGTLTGKKLNELIQEHAFEESLLTIPAGLKGGTWRLLRGNLTTPLNKEPSMPLTLLEKRWMKTLLSDPRILLFQPDLTGLEDVEPLFAPDMVTYYDRYLNGDDYRDPDYIRRFSVILQALRENRNLFVSFESRLHTHMEAIVTPYYLEYSEKDDRFRLIAAGKDRRWIINLSRIQACKLISRGRTPHDVSSNGFASSGERILECAGDLISDGTVPDADDFISGGTVPDDDDLIFDGTVSDDDDFISDGTVSYSAEHMPLQEPILDTVTLELEDRRNALERVLLHFSHLEKETKRLDRTHYRVTLNYERSDETEMLIRILSFGPVVKVTGPERMVELIRERIRKQKMAL